MSVVSGFVIFVLLFIGDFCYGGNESPEAIQIFVPVNHTLQLEINELKRLLKAENIKDRYVVVVSIAGKCRQGKSFLLNLLIRYLNAKYRKHDVSDWLGENMNGTKSNGFNWRGGSKPETQGIWMWSDIFTHDYENGEKVAIVLLDTQGLFDGKTTTKEDVTIFAMSTMLSSLQCFNILHSIREDDLQHLEVFTKYGEFALKQSNQTAFQSLLFIVRDWPFAIDYSYGLQKHFVNDLLAESDEQSIEMRQLRGNIKKSVREIDAFLMPYPGRDVARGTFNGDIQNIDPEFGQYVKVLAISILAPENLVVKEINGQKLKARDLVYYMQTYNDLFNGDSLPKPRSWLDAIAETQHHLLYNEYLDLYTQTMEIRIREFQPYFEESDLQNLHNQTKMNSISQFHEKPKLGGNTKTLDFEDRLKKAIDQQLSSFQQQNNAKRQRFIAQVEAQHLKLCNLHLGIYVEAMENRTREVEPYFQQTDLQNIHEQTKLNVISQVKNRFHSTPKICDNAINMDFEGRLKNLIDHEFTLFQQKNSEKRQNFVEKANAHNERQIHQIEIKYKDIGVSKIDEESPYFNNEKMESVLADLKQKALTEFDQTKMGNADISNSIRTKLEQNLVNDMYRSLRDRNNLKKNAYEQQEEKMRQDNEYKPSSWVRFRDKAVKQVKSAFRFSF